MGLRTSTAIATAACAFAAFGASAAAKPPDVIRVGGPSAPGDAKVAIVATATNLDNSPFDVVDASNAVVAGGTLSRFKGGSTAPWRRAYRADLSSVTAPGSYRVKVGALTSPQWEVGDPGASIDAMLGFFDANSDGNEFSPIHGPAHLNDAVVASGPLAGSQVDLTGGWMDAGDMIHFTQTTGFTATLLQAAARLDPAKQAQLDAAADVGIRWLLKAHPTAGVFIGQVGDERDHERGFADPALDDASGLPGIGVRSAYPAVGGDLAGKAAAALAMAADRSSGPTRTALITAAGDWYAAGKAAAQSAPGLPGGFYDSNTWRDDLAVGAAALARTTGAASYLTDALTYLAASELEGGFDWDTVAPLAAADICGALGAPALGNATQRAQACDALAVAGESAAYQAGRNPFGLTAPPAWGTTAENSGAAAIATLAGNAGQLADGRAVGARARDYTLGLNPWGVSFVAGYGPGSPQSIHSWASSFGPALPDGAVVGGPASRKALSSATPLRLAKPYSPFNSSKGVYEDRIDNYVTSEPALDYAAASILLQAAL